MGLAVRATERPEVRELRSIVTRYLEEPVMARVRVTGEVEQDRRPNIAGVRSWHLNVAAAQVLSVRPLAPKDWDRYLTWLEGPSPEPFRPSR